MNVGAGVASTVELRDAALHHLEAPLRQGLRMFTLYEGEQLLPNQATQVERLS